MLVAAPGLPASRIREDLRSCDSIERRMTAVAGWKKRSFATWSKRKRISGLQHSALLAAHRVEALLLAIHRLMVVCMDSISAMVVPRRHQNQGPPVRIATLVRRKDAWQAQRVCPVLPLDGSILRVLWACHRQGL